MKREITINTLVVCGFAARPPSLVRFILPRWGKSFVCSTLPSSILTERTIPQEFPRPFIRDSFVRYRELPYPRCLPALRFNPGAPCLHPSLSPPSLVDGGCSIKFPPSRIARVIGFLRPHPPPLLYILLPGYFLIGCHYYPYFLSLSIVSLSAKYKLSYAGMFPLTLFLEYYLPLFLLLHISFKILPNQLLLLSSSYLSIYRETDIKLHECVLARALF